LNLKIVFKMFFEVFQMFFKKFRFLSFFKLKKLSNFFLLFPSFWKAKKKFLQKFRYLQVFSKNFLKAIEVFSFFKLFKFLKKNQVLWSSIFFFVFQVQVFQVLFVFKKVFSSLKIYLKFFNLWRKFLNFFLKFQFFQICSRV
jgi:hypothetical protein